MVAVQPANARGGHAVTISIIFVAIAGVFVVFRCIARFGLVRTCGADDILILFSLVISVTFVSLVAAQEHHGLGRHLDSLSEDERVKTLRLFWASVIVYNLGLATTKCSILCQFLRFLVGPVMRRLCWTLLAIVSVYGMCTVFVSAFPCMPVAYFWDRNIKSGRCINLLAFWFANASFSIISDISICILPIPVLKSLQLPRRQKYSLMLVFGMGGFACLISILRLYSLYVIADSTDTTWDNVGAATWSSGELNVAIICACLPTLKPIVGRLYPRFLHHHHHTHNRQRNNHPELLRESPMQRSPGPEAAAGLDPTKDQFRSDAHHLENLHWESGNIGIAMTGEDEERWPITPEVHRKSFV